MRNEIVPPKLRVWTHDAPPHPEGLVPSISVTVDGKKRKMQLELHKVEALPSFRLKKIPKLTPVSRTFQAGKPKTLLSGAGW